MAKKQAAEPANSISDQLREIVGEYLAAGWGISTIAKTVGVAQSNLSTWYRGHRTIKTETADQLCRFFGVRLTKPRSIPEPPERAAIQRAAQEHRVGESNG